MTKKLSLRESKQRYLEEYEKYKDVQLVADVPYCKKTKLSETLIIHQNNDNIQKVAHGTHNLTLIANSSHQFGSKFLDRSSADSNSKEI